MSTLTPPDPSNPSGARREVGGIAVEQRQLPVDAERRDQALELARHGARPSRAGAAGTGRSEHQVQAHPTGRLWNFNSASRAVSCSLLGPRIRAAPRPDVVHSRATPRPARCRARCLRRESAGEEVDPDRSVNDDRHGASLPSPTPPAAAPPVSGSCQCSLPQSLRTSD